MKPSLKSEAKDVSQRIFDELVDDIESMIDRNALGCVLLATAKSVERFLEDKTLAESIRCFARNLPKDHLCDACMDLRKGHE